MRRLLALAMPFVAALAESACAAHAVRAKSPETRLAPSLHLSEEAAFLHVIDTISQWSPYCARADHATLGIPALGEADAAWLARYAAARRPLGYDAETGLFLWAESGFPLEGRPPGHQELLAALDHFRQIPGFRDPLARRMKELERFRPALREEVERLRQRMQQLRAVVDAFPPRLRTREVPIFIMYTLHPRGAQGGANGDGLYTELDPAASPERALHGMLLHEYLHLALRPREGFRGFTQSNARRKAWREALAQKAPDERGDDEASMLDEILVYALADVIVGERDPAGQVENYARHGDKQMVRMWDGVRILLPIVRRQLEAPASSRSFLAELIGAFVAKVQYRAWSCPADVTIAPRPS